MKTILIIGGSKGIGQAVIQNLVATHKIINISRSKPHITNTNLIHYNCNVLNDELPEIEQIDGLIYCPGSINLKPIGRLTLDDFKEDFEINVLGAVKVIKTYLDALKLSKEPAIVLFSTVASKLGMPFHAIIGSRISSRY
jgi:short-subunit dehydrogenase